MKLNHNFNIIFLLAIFCMAISLLASEGHLKFLTAEAVAPRQKLYDIKGERHAFPAPNSWNLIAYWSLFCHSCIEEMPILQKELKKPEFNGLKSFYVSLDSAKMRNAIKNYMTKRQLKATVLLEEIASNTYVTADKWGVTMTPSVFIVSPDGLVKFSHEGPSDMQAMLQKLRELMQSNKPHKEIECYDK